MNKLSLQDVLNKNWDYFVVHEMPRAFQSLGFGDTCLYRTEAGTGCAIGCCIPDSVYDISMEGKGIKRLFMLRHGVTNLFYSYDQDALHQLQSCHDKPEDSKVSWFGSVAMNNYSWNGPYETHADKMRDLLTQFARVHGLTIPEEKIITVQHELQPIGT